MIETFGMAATVFTVLSLFQKDMIKLRIVNSIGCILFITYGLMISAMSVVISNALILIINGRRLLDGYNIRRS